MSWRDHPACPPDGSTLCKVSDIPADGGFEVRYGDEREPVRFLLLRRGDQVWAYENRCPHFSLPLNFHPQVFVTLDSLIMCAHHTAFFKFEDGSCVEGPCAGTGLTPVPIVCTQGQVRLLGGATSTDAGKGAA